MSQFKKPLYYKLETYIKLDKYTFEDIKHIDVFMDDILLEQIYREYMYFMNNWKIIHKDLLYIKFDTLVIIIPNIKIKIMITYTKDNVDITEQLPIYIY